MDRQIEWVGQPSLLTDKVRLALTMGQYSKAEARIIREAARKRVMRVDGHTRRVLRATDVPGLTRDYVWGPAHGTFVLDMPESDARLVIDCPNGDQFRDVTPGIDDGERLKPAEAAIAR